MWSGAASICPPPPSTTCSTEAFGWEVPTYVHCSPVMRDAQNKMSKRHGDPSYEDLKAQGYLTEAIVNYVALLGWSPKGELAEQEIFTLPELVKAFDIAGISKSPAIFDRAKLDHFNAVYLRAMAPEAFAKVAEPYIRQTVKGDFRHSRHRRPAPGPVRAPFRHPRKGGFLRRLPGLSYRVFHQ